MHPSPNALLASSGARGEINSLGAEQRKANSAIANAIKSINSLLDGRVRQLDHVPSHAGASSALLAGKALLAEKNCTGFSNSASDTAASTRDVDRRRTDSIFSGISISWSCRLMPAIKEWLTCH